MLGSVTPCRLRTRRRTPSHRSLVCQCNHPDDLHDLGTTFVLPDPTIAPEELCVAVERNWWPARLDELFTVEIEDVLRNVLVPSPRRNPDLHAFVAAYDLLQTNKMEDTDGDMRLSRTRFNRMTVDSTTYELGELALAAEPSGWTFPSSEDSGSGGEIDGESDGTAQTEDRSLVALVGGREWLSSTPRRAVRRHTYGAYS